MPRLSRKPCAYPGCPETLEYTARKYCARHAPSRDVSAEERRRTKPRKRFYGLASWQRLRRLFLRAHPWCLCGAAATVVDHVIPIADGGEPLDAANLQPMCASCHSKKSAQECNRFGKEPRK